MRRSPPQRVAGVARERAARGGRALPEASLESVLGGEGRGAQPGTTHLLSRGRRWESTRRMRAAFGAELWDRPGQAPVRALYWGRTGFCEWVNSARKRGLFRLLPPRHTLCPEGNSANLRSRPGLSQQLSQGRDRISGLARDAAHGDARSSQTPPSCEGGACESGTRWVSSPRTRGPRLTSGGAGARKEPLRAPCFSLSSLMKDGAACGHEL